MHTRTRLFTATAFALAAATALAKTTTWTGDATGKAGTAKSFLDTANWDNGVPAAGDTIVVTNSTAWNHYVYFGTGGETLDLGTKGITIDNAGWIKCAVKFTGSGTSPRGRTPPAPRHSPRARFVPRSPRP